MTHMIEIRDLNEHGQTLRTWLHNPGLPPAMEVEYVGDELVYPEVWTREWRPVGGEWQAWFRLERQGSGWKRVTLGPAPGETP